MDWLDRASLVVGTFWLDRGAFIFGILMIPYGVAITIWPPLFARRPRWFRWSGLVLTFLGALLVADHLHFIGPG